MTTAGCGNSGGYYFHYNDGGRDVANLLFQEETQGLMGMEYENSSSSFTALLGLPSSKAMELLHHQDVTVQIGKQESDFEIHRSVDKNPNSVELVDRAAKFSEFASEHSSPSTDFPFNSPNNSSPNAKLEPCDSDSCRPTISKVKRDGKKRKKRKKEGGSGDEKVELPYIHVRVRRGQATDSHSLAERARREKINTRMKFLQELVPGCSKISGTALVLEEIINHVQFLQRQIEFLSMRLASINPGIDYGNLNRSFAEKGTSCDGVKPKQLEHIWQVDLAPPPASYHPSSSLKVWNRDDESQQQQIHGLMINSAPLQKNHLKTEM